MYFEEGNELENSRILIGNRLESEGFADHQSLLMKRMNPEVFGINFQLIRFNLL